MNIEGIARHWNKKPTRRTLERKLSNFADVLSHGRWRDEHTQMVETTQCVVERLGGGYAIGEYEVDPIFTEVTVSFSAKKEFEWEDGTTYALPRYTITSTVAQDIDKNDIPPYVLDEIMSDAKDDDHLGNDLLDQAGFGALLDGIDGVDDPEEMDNLDQFQIKREQELEYEVLYDGEVDDYTVTNIYSFDDIVMHQVSYRQSDGQVHTRPVTYGDGTLNDRQPLYVPRLTTDAIEAHLTNFDSNAEKFFVEQTLRSLETLSQAPEHEHIRKIIGMLGVVSSGYVPRHWRSFIPRPIR